MANLSFDDLFALERVSKRIRNAVMKVGWPRRDTLSHEAIIQNSNYSDYDRGEWEERHKYTIKFVSYILTLDTY